MKKKIKNSLEITILNTIKDNFGTWITFYVSKQTYKGVLFFKNGRAFNASNNVMIYSSVGPTISTDCNLKLLLCVQGDIKSLDHKPMTVTQSQYIRIQQAIKEYNMTMIDFDYPSDKSGEDVTKKMRIKKIHSYMQGEIKLTTDKQNTPNDLDNLEVMFVITEQSHTQLEFSNQSLKEKLERINAIEKNLKDITVPNINGSNNDYFAQETTKIKSYINNNDIASGIYIASNGIILRSCVQPQLILHSSNYAWLFTRGASPAKFNTPLIAPYKTYRKIQQAIREYNKFHKKIHMYENLVCDETDNPNINTDQQKHVIHTSYQNLETLEKITQKDLEKAKLPKKEKKETTVDSNGYILFGTTSDSTPSPVDDPYDPDDPYDENGAESPDSAIKEMYDGMTTASTASTVSTVSTVSKILKVFK